MVINGPKKKNSWIITLKPTAKISLCVMVIACKNLELLIFCVPSTQNKTALDFFLDFN